MLWIAAREMALGCSESGRIVVETGDYVYLYVHLFNYTWAANSAFRHGSGSYIQKAEREREYLGSTDG